MAAIDIVDIVRDANERLALIGQGAKQLHHSRFGAGVEAAGRLVDVEQGGAGQQLGPKTDALDLSAAEVGHERVAVRLEFHELDDVLHARFELSGCRVGRQPQPGRVVKGPRHGQLVVHDVLLGHVAKRLAEVVKMPIEVLTVGEHLAPRRPSPAVEAIHQCALARTARTKDADEFTRLDDQVDVVEQFARLPLHQRHRLFQPARFQTQALAVVDGEDGRPDQRKHEWPDAHRHILGDEAAARQPLSAQCDAVHAAEVGQPQSTIFETFELGMMA